MGMYGLHIYFINPEGKTLKMNEVVSAMYSIYFDSSTT